MKKTPKTKKAPSIVDVDQTVSLEEQIARRAHDIWLQGGRESGNDWTHWFQAEREINDWHHKHLRAE
jgi:hypothetical protein